MDDLELRARALYDQVSTDPRFFETQAELVAAEARDRGHPVALVNALRAQAWAARSHFALSQARVLLADAAQVARRNGLTAELRDVLITRAAVNHEQGRVGSARRDLELAHRLDPSSGTPDLSFQHAALLHNQGQLAEAGELYRRILDDPQASATVRIKAANNYAIIQALRGQPVLAQQLLSKALSFADPGPHLTAVLASTQAWVTTQTGRLTQGLAEFEEARRLHIAAGVPLAEFYLEYVDALVDLRLLPEAYEVAGRAVAELDQHGVGLVTSEGLLRVGRLAALLGDDQAALASLHEARSRFRTQRRGVWRARADVVLGELALKANQLSGRALATAHQAATTLDAAGSVADAVDAHLVAGRMALALSRTPDAQVSFERAFVLGRDGPVLLRLKARLARTLGTGAADKSRLPHCRAGLRDLSQHRRAFASLELRVRASGHGTELGQLGLEVLVRHGTPGQILEWMERTRAAALVAVEPTRAVDVDDELAALRAVHTELAEAQAAGRADTRPLFARQRAIEERIRQRTWSSAGDVSEVPRAVGAAQLRRELAGQVLVEYGALREEMIAVVLDARRSRVVRLGPIDPVRHYADVLLFGLRRLTRKARSSDATALARQSVAHALDRLRDLLLQPLHLPADQPIVVSPTARLRRIPWAALHHGPVAVVPAASFWARTARPARPGGRVILVAGPELPGAVEEVSQLTSLYPAPTVLVPPRSTIDAVLAPLRSADVAHIACHGRIRLDNPAFSGLQLHDGLLTLHEMDLRQVAPRRMILAACDSAVEVAYDEGEVLGFVGALLARGTCGLIASVVVVPDARAVPLMREVHQHLRAGQPMQEALHQARSALDVADDHDLVNWCAFNAYGAA